MRLYFLIWFIIKMSIIKEKLGNFSYLLTLLHYMNKSLKVKKTIKNEQDFKDKVINWDYTVFDKDWVYVDIEHTEEGIKTKLKIKINNKNYFMVNHLEVNSLQNIATHFWKGDKPWFVYLGYFYILMNSMDYNNKVDFNILRWIWLSEPMIKYIRWKLKEIWFIKRFWNDFYINPNIARKWQNIPLYIIDLFKNIE